MDILSASYDSNPRKLSLYTSKVCIIYQ